MTLRCNIVISQIQRGSRNHEVKHKLKQHFVINTLFYWNPMKIIKHRCYVLTFAKIKQAV